ncbi:hypothetical protein GCM10010384_50870 [Streptomyces djakartensis]|uniref:Uncharacterized protein n=1 Tax=Streptomyces djakartensis TaxID=68193 RepID=A0ABQ3A675_9ACTN|nr:hypothetical protein GCM10010384_50870 [Streptomyces djakartensis]
MSDDVALPPAAAAGVAEVVRPAEELQGPSLLVLHSIGIEAGMNIRVFLGQRLDLGTNIRPEH